MSQFAGIVRHEFSMSIRRPGFWIAYSLVGLFILFIILTPSTNPENDIITQEKILPEAGHIVFMFNIFMPLLTGILSADRMQRDFRSGMRELQRSTPMSLPAYILGKYIGIVASVLVPTLLFVLATGVGLVITGLAPIQFLWPLFLAYLSISVPSNFFVVAFSLACPLILPLRIYQVLFTGYWFWGNLISPQAFPTISDTLLNAVGQIPLQAFFYNTEDTTHPLDVGFTQTDAMMNILVLFSCVAAVLFCMNLYLRRVERRA